MRGQTQKPSPYLTCTNTTTSQTGKTNIMHLTHTITYTEIAKSHCIPYGQFLTHTNVPHDCDAHRSSGSDHHSKYTNIKDFVDKKTCSIAYTRYH